MIKEKLYKLTELGYSVTPLERTKKPINSGWQTTTLTKEQIQNTPSEHWGLVCGLNDVEVIDIDLKVLSSWQEQKEWWDEFISFCNDNIEDFEDKFVIQKTMNKGYHIIYRCKVLQGNTKIAKLQGHTEAIIETRGKGGQIMLYDNIINGKTYIDIKEVTEEDRFILWSICKTYNFQETEIEVKHTKTVKEYDKNDITPWQDYNNKTSIFDLIGDDFKIIRQLKDKYIIKRHGATSPHSGYIYLNSGCMYLFSTGTIYPHEQLITPYIAYTYKFHNGDFKASAKELYNLGFGTRSERHIKEQAKAIVEQIDVVKIDEKDLIFPIDIFPKPIQSYISDCHSTLNNSIDYMGCSLLWVISTCIGNSMRMEVKKGWIESPSIWVSLVGKAGIGKTPSINSMIFPLKKINNREVQQYFKENEKFEYYNTLSPKDKKEVEEVQKPVKKQFIANDITLEALIDLHQECDNAVGVFKDELAGWLKDMNKYRAGSDLEFWLSSWSSESVNMNRVTRGVSFINRPFIPVLGGIQPSILSGLSTEENKTNGFMDRLLLSYPELKVDYYNENEINEQAYSYYNDAITLFYDTINRTNHIIKRDKDGNIEPLILRFDSEAKKEWKRIHDNYSDIQNSDEENEYLKSMYPKQKSYIPRFALLIHVFNGFIDNDSGVSTLITKESLLKAEKLSNYFVNMAKKINISSEQVNDIKSILNSNKTKSKKEQFIEVYKNIPNFNKTELANIIGVTRKTIHTWQKEIEKKV